MFNFHKPRTYRSAEGCCVCRAKTSSSRFIDSRKYESDMMLCFDLKQPRQGDICNACVLLTKRYKRLPQGSKKNWSHMVDARVGVPGNNKLHVKYKSERINSKVNNNNNINNNNNNNINNSNNNNNNNSSNSNENISNNHSSTVGNNNSSTSVNFMPEKFTKIYKKSKRTKDTSSTIVAAGTGPPGSKRRSNSHGWSQNLSSNSLPPTPDSMDSDYEDSRLYGALANTVVQFQTQTRASAHRAAAVANARRHKAAIKVGGGSKRRKCLPPRKYRKTSAYDENVRFFEAAEWQERKTCCGIFYECTGLGGSLLLDVAQYNPCENHKQLRPSDNFDDKKVIKITTTPSSSLTKTPTVASNDTVNGCGINTFKATPALKKHHLFYKRQSECFPHADIIAANDNQSQSASVQHKTTNLHCNGAATKMHSVASTPPTTTSPNKSLNKTDFDKNSSLMYQKCTARNSSNVQDTVTMSNAIQPNSGNYVNMLKHSSARTTTLTAPTTISSTCVGGNTRAALSKTPSTFLHKLKGDSGRIVKQTLDKFNNTATIAQLKTNDFMDMKQMIKTVDKSHILHKSSTSALATPAAPAPNNISAAAYNVTTYQTPSQPLTKASLSAASPTSSTSSTSSSSTKFSDNSSDSGFDENLLDRKSASPLQEDNEKKFSSRSTAGTGGGGGGGGGVQTMFLTSGVQIQSQPTTNIMIGGGGHEIASKLLQNRKQQQKQVYSALLPMTTITPNNHSVTPNSAITSSVKITQISASSTTGNLAVPAVGVAAQAKMRAIYNNNNTIQHENGITTILPASSLAATNQTAAMNYMQPSTVTITPAPPPGAPQPINPNMGQKLTAANANTATTTGTANVIHLPTANNKLITTTLTGGGHQAAYLHATNNNIKNNLPHNYQYQQQQHQHHVYNNNYAQSNLQQKVVLLKTSSTASNSQKYHRHGSSVAAKVGSGASNDNRSGSATIR